jgi:hypothetical protein
MSLKITGKIHRLYPPVQVSEKFRKREFILEVMETVNGEVYAQYVKLQAVQGKADMLNNYQLGQTVTVHFNLKGNMNEKDGKELCFTNLDAWKVELPGQAAAPTQGGGAQQGYQQPGYGQAPAQQAYQQPQQQAYRQPPAQQGYQQGPPPQQQYQQAPPPQQQTSPNPSQGGGYNQGYPQQQQFQQGLPPQQGYQQPPAGYNGGYQQQPTAKDDCPF